MQILRRLICKGSSLALFLSRARLTDLVVRALFRLVFPSNAQVWGGPVYRQQPHAEAASYNHMHYGPASGSGFTTPTASAGSSASSTPAPPAFAQLPVTALRVHEEKAAGRKHNRKARRVTPTTSAAPKRKCASVGTLSDDEIKRWVGDAQAVSGYFKNKVSC